MPKRTIQFCEEIFEFLQDKGIEDACPRPVLIKAIRILAGDSEKTVQRYMRFLFDFDLIKSTEEAGTVILKPERLKELAK